MSMCRVFSCVVGRGCLLWPVCSFGKTLLAFALLHSVLQGQICLLIKRQLLLGRKVMTDLDSILKSKDITLPTKVHVVKAMVFPVVMCDCESCTIKKAECQLMDLWFWIVVMDKTLESPLDSKEIKPVNPKGHILWEDWCSSWSSNTLATWCE